MNEMTLGLIKRVQHMQYKKREERIWDSYRKKKKRILNQKLYYRVKMRCYRFETFGALGSVAYTEKINPHMYSYI